MADLFADAFKDDEDETKLFGQDIFKSSTVIPDSILSNLPESKSNNVSFMKVEELDKDCRNILAISEQFICYSVTAKKNLLRLIDKSNGAKTLIRGHDSFILDVRFATQNPSFFCSADNGDTPHVFFWKKDASNEVLSFSAVATLDIGARQVFPHPVDTDIWLVAGVTQFALVSVSGLLRKPKTVTNFSELPHVSIEDSCTLEDLSFCKGGTEIAICVLNEAGSYEISTWGTTKEGLIQIYSSKQNNLVFEKLVAFQAINDFFLVAQAEAPPMGKVNYRISVLNYEDTSKMSLQQSVVVSLPKFLGKFKRDGLYRASLECSLSVGPLKRFVVLSCRKSNMVACLALSPSRQQDPSVQPLYHITLLNLRGPVVSICASTVLLREHHSAEQEEAVELTCYQEEAGDQATIQQYHVPVKQLFDFEKYLEQQGKPSSLVGNWESSSDDNNAHDDDDDEPSDKEEESEKGATVNRGNTILNILSKMGIPSTNKSSEVKKEVKTDLENEGKLKKQEDLKMLTLMKKEAMDEKNELKMRMYWDIAYNIGERETPPTDDEPMPWEVKKEELSKDDEAPNNIQITPSFTESDQPTVNSTKGSTILQALKGKSSAPAPTTTTTVQQTTSTSTVVNNSSSGKSAGLAAMLGIKSPQTSKENTPEPMMKVTEITTISSNDVKDGDKEEDRTASETPTVEGSKMNQTKFEKELASVRQDVKESLRLLSKETAGREQIAKLREDLLIESRHGQARIGEQSAATVRRAIEVELKKAFDGSSAMNLKWKQDMTSQLTTSLTNALAPVIAKTAEQAAKKAVEAALGPAFSAAFANTLIPALEAGTSTAFSQMQQAFEVGMGGLVKEGRKAQELYANSTKQLEKEIRELRGHIKQLEDKISSSSSAPMEDAFSLLEKGQIAEAVVRVLEGKDISNTVALLSRLTPVQVIETCNALIRLCVTQQLAADMSVNTPEEGLAKRLEWIKNLVLSLASEANRPSKDPTFQQNFQSMIQVVLDSIQATKKIAFGPGVDSAVSQTVSTDLQLLEFVIRSQMK